MKRVGVVTEIPRRALQKQRRHGAERRQMLIRCNLRENEPRLAFERLDAD